MELLKLLVICMVFLACESSISRPASRFLSRREIAQITKIAEKSIAEQLEKAVEKDTDEEIYVEPTPPEPESVPSVENEIETIRRNISQSNNTVECNITAGYLWELCRPVLLRTCREQYRTQCSSAPRQFMNFNRRLNHMFQNFRTPETIFKPQPLIQWFENKITEFNDAIANSSDYQFSISITRNGDTQTYTNDDVVENMSNITQTIRRTLADMNSQLFPKFRHFGLPHQDNTRAQKTNFFGRLFASIKNAQKKDKVIETPAKRFEIHVDNSNSRLFNPSRTAPKRLSKSKQLLRSPRSPMRRRKWSRQSRIREHLRSETNRMQQQQQQRPLFHPPSSVHQPWLRHSRWPRIHTPQMGPFHPVRRGFPWHNAGMHPWFNNNHKPVSRNGEIEINCQQMEQNPEVCLEIAERKQKCETELEKVCPNYMETRRRIEEQLNDVFTRQEQVTRVSTGNDDKEKNRMNEKYEWATKLTGQETPIVIESIKVTQQGSGDAYVTAKLFDTVRVKLLVPGTEFDSSNESLGEAISRVALDSLGKPGSREDP